VIEEQHDYQRASQAYLIWPLALAALVREQPAASRWTRIHTRQALTFGLAASIGYLVLMALPLLVVVIAGSGISTGATVAVYYAGMLLDLVAFIMVTIWAFSHSARAARGELFTIPVVSGIADRIFPINR
jgi:uncharacterized membrane protein